MTVLSKLLNDEFSTPFNCYEIAHVWDPNCTTNAFNFTTEIFMKCCGLYGGLFIASHIVFVRKYDVQSLLSTGVSILRSSAFIANHVLMFFTLFCGSRALLGKFYFRFHAFPITFLISYVSLQIEKKSRRGPLALYVLNIGSECLLRILVDRGILPTVPHAPVILFTLTMTALLYLIRKDGYGSDPVSFALRLVLGTAEAHKRKSKRQRPNIMEAHYPRVIEGSSTPNKESLGDETSSETTRRRRRRNLDVNFNELIPDSMKPRILSELGKHVTCRHRESCVEYSVMGFLRPFAAAWMGSTLFSIVKKAPKLRYDPLSVIKSSFTDTKNVRFGLFLGSFAGIYKAVNCYLRHRYDGPQNWHSAVGGFLAGPSMLIYPHTTISLYFFWKLVDTIFVKGVKQGYITNPAAIVNITYAISVSLIAYFVILQPRYMRPSYIRLANLLTEKFHLLNRCFVTFLVPEAIEGYEDYFADLHPDHTSQKFKECVIPWLLEAKDYMRRR